MTTSILKKLRESGPLHRTAVVTRAAVDEKARTVTLAFSSEEPYRRWFGFEILGHAAGEADLSFVTSGAAPLLDGHDTQKQIGVIEKAWIEADRKGRAVVRFSKNQAAEEVWQDILDGIRRNISVGYEVNSMTLIEDSAKDGKSYRVDSWTPLEVSVVAIPADRTVGVGRNNNTVQNQSIKDKSIMDTKNEQNNSGELHRIKEIQALGNHPGGDFKDAAQQALAEGWTVERFRSFVLDELKRKPTHSPINADPNTFGRGRCDMEPETPIRDAILSSMPEFAGSRDAGRARERSQEEARRTGRQAKGLLVDLGTPQHERSFVQRGMATNVISQGGALVGVQQMPLIEALTAAALCFQAGAASVTSLVGDCAYPKITAGMTAYWLNEGQTTTESTPGFGQIRMTPKTLAARCVISRRLILQTANLAEQVVRAELARQFGVAIDAAIITGTGSAGQPRGILNTTGIGSVTLGAANTPTWANIVDLETEVSADNALVGNLAYLTTATIAGKMKQTEKTSGNGDYILADGKSNSYPVFITGNVPEKHIIFGNWADALVGFWSGMDIVADPYSNSAKGEIIVQAFIDLDVIIRHAESFADGYKA